MVSPRTRSMAPQYGAVGRRLNDRDWTTQGKRRRRVEYSPVDDMQIHEELPSPDTDTGAIDTAPGVRRGIVEQRAAMETGAQRPVRRRRAVARAASRTPCYDQSSPILQNSSGQGSGPSVQEKRSEERLPQSPSSPARPFPSSSPLLRWKDMPYPGLPQPYYAFSYASGPIHFRKVRASASKRLASQCELGPGQNYQAYVIYSLSSSPEKDNKSQGLQMVNQLAAQGFIEEHDCDLYEEIIEGKRALTFQLGEVAVYLLRLGGDERAFRGYCRKDKLDAEDQATIAHGLQNVMHYQALPNQACDLSSSTSSLTSIPSSAMSSSVADTPQHHTENTVLAISTDIETTSPSFERIADLCNPPGSLEASGLIKFVRAYWRHSKRIIDNIDKIRSSHSGSRLDGVPHDSLAVSEVQPRQHHPEHHQNPFKVAVVYSNKREKQQGLDLLGRMIRLRLRTVIEERDEDVRDRFHGASVTTTRLASTPGIIVTQCEESTRDGEVWTVYRIINDEDGQYLNRGSGGNNNNNNDNDTEMEDDDDDDDDDDNKDDIGDDSALAAVVGFPGRWGDRDFLNQFVPSAGND